MAQTLTVQNVLNFAATHTELVPLAGVGGYTNEPALSLANDVLSELLMGGSLLAGKELGPFPWRCNRAWTNLFVTSYGKNDYLWAGASAFTIAGSLTGAAIDLKSNNGITVAAGVVTVNTLEPHNFVVGDVVYMTGNTDAPYNSTFTAGPQNSQWSNGWTITAVTSKSFSFAAGVGQTIASGAPGITNMGWIETFTFVQMTDVSFPQFIRYGLAVRTLPPFSRVGSFPDRLALLQDLGTGVIKLRVQPLPGNTPLGITIVYQAQAPVLTALSANWGPFPDEYSAMIRQAFLARCYRFIDSRRSEVESQKAEAMILAARARDDAEESEDYITPDQPLMGWVGAGGGGWWM